MNEEGEHSSTVFTPSTRTHTHTFPKDVRSWNRGNFCPFAKPPTRKARAPPGRKTTDQRRSRRMKMMKCVAAGNVAVLYLHFRQSDVMRDVVCSLLASFFLLLLVLLPTASQTSCSVASGSRPSNLDRVLTFQSLFEKPFHF